MSETSHDTTKESKIWKTFTLNIGGIILVFIVGLFLGLITNYKQLIETEMHTQAKAYFDNIVLTRKWNADFGGVYVEKKEGIESNPYLKNPDITSQDGVVYTKKNPALMTREISEIATSSSGTGTSYRFHITSLNPLNPNNKPDDFEIAALQSFEEGNKEVLAKAYENNKVFYRYMAPLVVEPACLGCHVEQGYKLGDIRGGISVRFDITNTEKELERVTYLFVALGILASLILFGVIYLFIVRLMKKLNKALADIMVMATTDSLTGLSNRRHFFETATKEVERAKRYPQNIGLLMIDVDLFKHLNDKYGHQAGDAVLKQIGEIMRNLWRDSDIVARYGGEEFIVLMPEADKNGTMTAAEKIRTAIEANPFHVPNAKDLAVTISVGASCLETTILKEDTTIEAAIKSADAALYRAKELGRNRVEYLDIP